MSISNGVAQADIRVDRVGSGSRQHRALELLRRGFSVEFHLIDGLSGELIHCSADQPRRDWHAHAELYRQVAQRGRPEILEEEPPLLVLAVPLPEPGESVTVAAAMFTSRPVGPDEDLSQAAAALGIEPGEAAYWASRQTAWAAEGLDRVARLLVEMIDTQQRLEELEEETQSISVNLAATYEEISFLYRLTQNLRISESDEALGRAALEWMEEVVPAEGLAIQLLPVSAEGEALTHHGRTESVLLCFGRCPLEEDQFDRLIDHLRLRTATKPVVINGRGTQDPSWPFPEIRQMIAVPLAEGDNLFGLLLAFNHVDGAEFGTVEANLLSSVGTILGIHSGNIELYRQQGELLAGIVRALTSAIDAKDRYTCGHSDRVARAAVRLAQELGCDPETINTTNLSGLLHDIGKIGIDDQVLRKPGKLTDEEYEHIKRHARIGHRILFDLKKLDDILPVVLHHHESWDGRGYPGGLAAEAIPLPARIVAVADAFDAMGSDRPYRKGMPGEKIDEIFQSGSGEQWDPQVIEAFFRARDDFRQIMQGDPGNDCITAEPPE